MSVIEQCRQWLQSRRSVPQAPSEFASDLEQWAQSPLGQALLASEKKRIDELLSMRFGYHLAQHSIFPGLDWTGESRINHKFCLQYPQAQGAQDLSSLAFDGCQIPLASDSVDVLVLHHSLEFSRCPHDLLREAQRVLIAHGHLIVTVFNPYSLLGIYGLFGRFWHRNHIWRRRLLSASANKDWLQLLGLQPLEQHAHLYRPPLSQQGLLSSTRWVETLGQKMGGLNWGASYTILARKDVAAMTPIKPKWQEVSGGDKLVVGAVSRGAPRLVLVENKPLKTETKPVK